jgi:hypothetical protein
MKITERERAEKRQSAIRADLADRGITDPSTAPNGTRAALWRLALEMDIVSQDEFDAARAALDWKWTFTGD